MSVSLTPVTIRRKATSVRAVPSVENGTTICTIYDVTESCVKSELLFDAVSLTNITDCDAEEADAVKSLSVDISSAGEPYSSQDVAASVISDVAAVGGNVGQLIIAESEEECLHSCVTYFKGCSIVTTRTTFLLPHTFVCLLTGWSSVTLCHPCFAHLKKLLNQGPLFP